MCLRFSFAKIYMYHIFVYVFMFVEVNDYSLEHLPKGGLDSEGWKWIDSVMIVPSLHERFIS